MAKPILFSGIQPSGRLHVGNYFGALEHFAALQESGKFDCLFCVVDLHSITESFDPKEKKEQILAVAADFLAAGLDPARSVIFQQSQVAAHSELAWILNTITPIGELERMTQYKDKAARQKENVNVGLFDYPVLMAADILLYRAAAVPVGDDQLQHIELARTLARKFNNRFGKTFIEPKGLLARTPRIMSLKDPAKKMSKSQPEGCLFLDDDADAVRAKIARAVTDSGSEVAYDPDHRPGLANLLDLYAAVDPDRREPKTIAKLFAGKQYADFKRGLAEAVARRFEPYRKAKAELARHPERITAMLAEGSAKANRMAAETMHDVKEKLGLAV